MQMNSLLLKHLNTAQSNNGKYSRQLHRTLIQTVTALQLPVNRRWGFIALSFLLCACSRQEQEPSTTLQPQEAIFAYLAQGTWIDLSHDFSSDTLYWPTASGFKHNREFVGTTEAGYYYSAYNFSSSEHGGTHLDAPIHFAEGRLTADAIPLNKLIATAAVIDVSVQASANPDYQISVSDIEAWEQRHGTLTDGTMVLFNTGWHQFWPQAEQYLGTAQRGSEAVADLHFPGISPQLAVWLVSQRNIAAIGIDTPSIDFGQSKLFQSHRTLFASDIPAFENITNLNALPPMGALVVALPMKIKNGSGGPLRIVAWVPHDE